MNGMDGVSLYFSIDRQFAKVEVAGSNPVSRFSESTIWQAPQNLYSISTPLSAFNLQKRIVFRPLLLGL